MEKESESAHDQATQPSSTQSTNDLSTVTNDSDLAIKQQRDQADPQNTAAVPAQTRILKLGSQKNENNPRPQNTSVSVEKLLTLQNIASTPKSSSTNDGATNLTQVSQDTTPRAPLQDQNASSKRAEITLVKLAAKSGSSTSGAPKSSSANNGATILTSLLASQATTPKPPFQSQNASSKRAEITLVKVPAKDGSNTPGAAFAIVKLPPQSNSSQSKIAIVKLSPSGGTTNANSSPQNSQAATTKPDATSAAPHANAPQGGATLINPPPPPYSALYVNKPTNTTGNLPSTTSTSFQPRIVHTNTTKFLVGGYTWTNRRSGQSTRHLTYSNDVPCCVFTAVLLLMCMFIFLTPLTLICTLPALYYISMVSIHDLYHDACSMCS